MVWTPRLPALTSGAGAGVGCIPSDSGGFGGGNPLSEVMLEPRMGSDDGGVGGRTAGGCVWVPRLEED